jgi:hypothetical protein
VETAPAFRTTTWEACIVAQMSQAVLSETTSMAMMKLWNGLFT